MTRQRSKKIDPTTLEVVRMRLEAIVEEMAVTMLRAAHSTLFSETRDFSVALLDRQGGLMAMGQFIPHHQGGMQAALQSIIEEKGIESMRPGDIYFTNDAYVGGTHTPDCNMFLPIFVEDELVMFSGSCGHQIDIGGSESGSYCVGATSIYQEGIRFPRIKIGEGGEFFDDFVRIFQRNVRLPEQQRGDLAAQLASLKVAIRHVPSLIEQYGVRDFQKMLEEILDSSERRVRTEIEKIPDGTYSYVDYLDHDGVNDCLLKMQVTMTVKGSDVMLDFTGTDAQGEGFVNASLSNSIAACYAAFFLFLDPTIPRNNGYFRPIGIHAPEGTVVNPRHPAPIGASTTEGGGRIYDLVIGALSKACPDRALGTWSMMWLGVFLSGIHPKTGSPYIHTIIDGVCTGGGARADDDGLHATSIAASNVLIPNVEIEESFFPVRYVRREITADTGGAGMYRGGCVLETEVMVLGDCVATISGSRFENAPPLGVYGGKPGAPSVVFSISDGHVTEYPPKITGVRFKPGDRLVIRACGGGGYGNPRKRDTARIERDIQLGFVTPEVAAREYGYTTKSAAE